MRDLAQALKNEGKELSVVKYFDLLWGSNIQLVCDVCHDKTRQKVKLEEKDLLL